MGKYYHRWRNIAAVLTLLLGVLSSVSAFATGVSGPITSNTTWSLAQSPFEVTSDVTVDSGATLTIEAGVIVYFSVGTHLTVKNGALQASGTPATPILFTSHKDQSGTSPAAGDWGALRFLPGTFEATTRLEHAQVKYGHGILMQGASPTLNHVTMVNNAGAAISIDLQSSPRGEGLQASGNDVNGIVVPAGDIQSHVVWQLKGIPYVVEQGILSIGQTPVITSVTPQELPQGETRDMTITGTRLSGVDSITFDNSGVTGTLLAGATASSLLVRLTATNTATLGAVALEMQTAAGKIQFANAFHVIAPKPPLVVDTISPDTLRRGEAKTFHVTGQHLLGAAVTTTAAGLSLSSVQSTATSITFTLAATSSATLGPQVLTVTNVAMANGTATVQVTVLQALPTVSVAPTPLAIAPDALPRRFTIRLSHTDTIDHSFALSAADITVATVAPNAVTIPAGQTEVQATATGLKAGQTSITLASPTLGTIVFPVFVTSEFAGINTSYATNVGVVLAAGPIEPPPTTFTPLPAPLLGVVVGSHLRSIAPATITVGTGPISIVIHGVGLDATTTTSITPADGMTLGTFRASPDGTTLTLPLTAASTAPPTVRQVVLKAGSAMIPPISPLADRLFVTLPTPEVTSVEPQFVVRNSASQPLIIGGRHFQDLQHVTITPNDGIEVGSQPVLSADGTTLTLQIAVLPTASLGPRVVTVTTRGGVSSAVSVPANTFAIVSQIQQIITPITGAAVGVLLETTPSPPPPQPVGLGAASVGVTLGGVVTGMHPVAGSIGTTLTLTATGRELQGVNNVHLRPDTGMTVGTPNVATDGTSVTVDITIASNAPQTVRTVQLFAGATLIPPAPLAATQFLVTTPQPQIDAVSPLYWHVGQASAPLTITGKNFQNTQQVRVLPPNDVTLGLPAVDSNGTGITVSLSATSNAVLGTRVVVVDTAAGSTSTTATIANTITLTSTSGTTYTPIVAPQVGVVITPPSVPISTPIDPIVAASVGVMLQSAPPPPATQSLFLKADPLGVTLGPIATGLEPSGMLAGSSGIVMIEGMALDAISTVAIVPATDIVFGSPTVNVSAMQLSVPITIASPAAIGWRAVTLSAGNSRVFFSNPTASQLYIGGGVPSFDSISPIFATPGAAFMLTIRGHHLQEAVAVTASPADGLTLPLPITVDSTGTILTVPMLIAPNATLGARVIQVITPAATSSATAHPGNTFTVIAP